MKKQFNRRRFVKDAGLTSAGLLLTSHALDSVKINSETLSSYSEIDSPSDKKEKLLSDGLCNASVSIHAYQLLSLVCIAGGAECPLIENGKAKKILDLIKVDPTVAIRLESDADRIPRYTKIKTDDLASPNAQEVFNRKRDLDVFQRLGLVPGDTRRARYIFQLLFNRIETPVNICAYNTEGWEGCKLAYSGAYESLRVKGWHSIVFQRSEQEKKEYRLRNNEDIKTSKKLYVRPHHLMCLSCMYNGGKGLQSPNASNSLYEILQRIKNEPDIPITLVELTGMACESCDGFYPPTGRCTHSCGLIRDYKKDLGVFQKLGKMPGATMKAKDLFELLFVRIPSTHEICAFEDGIVRSQEWTICGGPDGSPGYANTRLTGIF